MPCRRPFLRARQAMPCRRSRISYGEGQVTVTSAGVVYAVDGQYVIRYAPPSVAAPTTPVATAAAQTPVYFTIGSAGTLPALSNANILTQGASGLDFTLGTGSTCTGALTAGTLCTVNVAFTPQAPGLRRGAVNLYNAAGTAIIATGVHQRHGHGPAGGVLSRHADQSDQRPVGCIRYRGGRERQFVCHDRRRRHLAEVHALRCGLHAADHHHTARRRLPGRRRRCREHLCDVPQHPVQRDPEQLDRDLYAKHHHHQQLAGVHGRYRGRQREHLPRGGHQPLRPDAERQRRLYADYSGQRPEQRLQPHGGRERQPFCERHGRGCLVQVHQLRRHLYEEHRRLRSEQQQWRGGRCGGHRVRGRGRHHERCPALRSQRHHIHRAGRGRRGPWARCGRSSTAGTC